METEDILAKKEKMKKWLSIGGIAAVGLIVSPIIFMTIQGLVGLAVAGAVGFTVVTFAPWFALKISNAKYRAIEAEKIAHLQKVQASAAENPIETMRNLIMQKTKAFNDFREGVTNAVTARDTFKSKCEKFAKKYPARALEFQKQLENLVTLVEAKKAALSEAQKSLEAGNLKLEEMEAYWEMSKDAQELNRVAGMDTGDAFERLKADTACDAVFESVNKAFAQLEVAAMLDVGQSNNVELLISSDPNVIELTPVKQSVKVV